MKNYWLNKIDRALISLGYLPQVVSMFSDEEKEKAIIREYLYILQNGREDCLPFSLEEMADFIIHYRQN